MNSGSRREQSDSRKHQIARSALKFPLFPTQNGVFGGTDFPPKVAHDNAFPNLPPLSNTRKSELSPFIGKVQKNRFELPLTTTPTPQPSGSGGELRRTRTHSGSLRNRIERNRR